MNVKEKAKMFAVEAHRGQVRKSEPEKPMIMHPIGVGIVLDEHGYDENVVAAGFLHDVVEDTHFTLDDIEEGARFAHNLGKKLYITMNIVPHEDDFDDYWMKLKCDANKKYELFPKREQFIKFLIKYYNEDYESFIRLFNIDFRSDEIHLNINSENSDRTISRIKDGTAPEESFPPVMKCGHVYNYASYIDSNHCCICDRNIIANSF